MGARQRPFRAFCPPRKSPSDGQKDPAKEKTAKKRKNENHTATGKRKAAQGRSCGRVNGGLRRPLRECRKSVYVKAIPTMKKEDYERDVK